MLTQPAEPLVVLLAGPRAFCAGVERAIAIVEAALARRGAPVYVRKQIVHNVAVVRGLEAKGAVFVDELDDVPLGACVVFSAHGVSPAVRDLARERGLDVLDATCPLVAKVHAEARRAASRGDAIVLIGRRGHDEADGIIGEAPERTLLVENAADVDRLQLSGAVSYLTQTTLAADEAHTVISALRHRYPHVSAPAREDICYATTNRQLALRAVAADADLVLVVGSMNSHNSTSLATTARKLGTPAHLIDGPAQIDPRWLQGVSVLGLTAGASASPTLVTEVIAHLRSLRDVRVQERTITTETITFAMPRTT
jgi:4-hydroxy-3-methylbut-2-enyl diphosphate reductase